jgi:hypothetical protein
MVQTNWQSLSSDGRSPVLENVMMAGILSVRYKAMERVKLGLARKRGPVERLEQHHKETAPSPFSCGSSIRRVPSALIRAS